MSNPDVTLATSLFPLPESSDLDPTMGGRIAMAREAGGFTQAQLASQLGVMVKTLKNWETDRSEPRGNKFVFLAGLLGVPVMWLMTGEDSAEETGAANYAETLTLTTKMDKLLALHQQSTDLILELQDEISRLQDDIDMGELEQAV